MDPLYDCSTVLPKAHFHDVVPTNRSNDTILNITTMLSVIRSVRDYSLDLMNEGSNRIGLNWLVGAWWWESLSFLSARSSAIVSAKS